MELNEGVGGKRWPKCLFTSAFAECTAQRQRLPRPKSHRRCGAILHTRRHARVWIWGCVHEMVCPVTGSHPVFPKFPSINLTNFDSKGTIGTRKFKLSKCAQVGKRWGGYKVMPCGPYLATFASTRGGPMVGMALSWKVNQGGIDSLLHLAMPSRGGRGSCVSWAGPGRIQNT